MTVEFEQLEEVSIVKLDPAGVWQRSEFPHPLVTVDFDIEDRPIQVSWIGRFDKPA